MRIGLAKMFTGLVEALATVHQIETAGAGKNLVLALPPDTGELTIGESVAINGVCLTVVACAADICRFQAGPETLLKTNLGDLALGERVNMERSLRFGDRLGGHLVQGHVDGLGKIADRVKQEEWELVWFSCPRELALQMVPKASVAVDGVSLTLVDVLADRFSAALIPHTLNRTTLGFKTVGQPVNLEIDLCDKDVLKFLQQIPGNKVRNDEHSGDKNK
jgi:riboflavin synthase